MAFKGICDKTVFLKPPALCRTATATKGVGNAVLLQHLLDMLGKAVSGLNTRLLLLFVLGGCGSRPLHGRTPSMGWRRWHDWGVSRLHTWMFLQHIIDGQQRFTSTTISPWWPGTSLGTCLGFGFRLSLGACLGFGRRFGLGSGFCLALALRFGLRFASFTSPILRSWSFLVTGSWQGKMKIKNSSWDSSQDGVENWDNIVSLLQLRRAALSKCQENM